MLDNKIYSDRTRLARMASLSKVAQAVFPNRSAQPRAVSPALCLRFTLAPYASNSLTCHVKRVKRVSYLTGHADST